MSKSAAEDIPGDETDATRASVQEPAVDPTKDMVDANDRVGAVRWLAGLGLRFGILYAGLFVVARVAGVMPDRGGIAGYYYRFKLHCVEWVGEHVLRLKQPIRHLADWSGDQVFDWVQVVTLLGLAFICALVWMGLDRSKRYERIAVEIIRIVLRYRLGSTMLGYGIDKILRVQMPEPGIARMMQTYGESSPMGLLWTFMGQSWVYSAFTGAVELVGGLLLLFRHTTTLGALIVAGVMMNVLMLNFGYDVPVKLYSTHYLLFAVALAAPDLRRLGNFFVFNRATPPVASSQSWPSARISLAVKVVAIGVILWYIPLRRTLNWANWQGPAKSEIHGLYEVEKFTYGGTERPPLTTDPLRWRRVGFDAGGLVVVVLMNDTRKYYGFRSGGQGGQFMLVPFEERNAPGESFTFLRNGNDHLSIKGTLNSASVVMELRRAAHEKMLLQERGFRRITEQALVK